MRMTASWFGSLDPPNTRLWRDRSALERELPSDRQLGLSTCGPSPTAFDRAAVADRGRRNALSDRTKKLTKEERWATLLKLLDKKISIQGVQSLL
jgi:hypothetical protein